MNQMLEDRLRELKEQSARMERRVEGLLAQFSAGNEDMAGSDRGGSALFVRPNIVVTSLAAVSICYSSDQWCCKPAPNGP